MGGDRKIRVLICPLDWGLGHATRSVPIINNLLEKNAEVVIGSDNLPLAFLKKEFPELETVIFPSYKISYPQKGSMVFKILLSVPAILKSIWDEHRLLDKLIKEYRIDVVISDNRYGLWNKNVFSVFVTHQLMIKCPRYLIFIEPFLKKIIYRFIKKYDECWIPDLKDENNLSGDLSHKYSLPENAFFINPLSRFNSASSFQLPASSFHLLVILSGPEPQRTIFEDIIIEQLMKYKSVKALLLKGRTDENEQKTISENINVYSHLNTKELYNLIQMSEAVVCRSGYSGLMDMVALGKKAILIPTPGQTEQEYIAEYLKAKKLFYYQNQNDFNLMKAIDESEGYNGLKIESDDSLLDKRIDNLLNKRSSK